MRRLLFLLSFVFVTPLFAEVRDEIIAADTARVQATVAGDLNRLSQLLSDSLLYGNSTGRILNKRDFLSTVGGSKLRYTGFDYDGTQIVKVTDEVAIMSGRAVLHGDISGIKTLSTISFMAVWKKEEGAWKLNGYQSSQISGN